VESSHASLQTAVLTPVALHLSMHKVPAKRLQRLFTPFRGRCHRRLSLQRRTHASLLPLCRASSQSNVSGPLSARQAVEAGDQLFKKKNYEQALSLYKKALQLSPDDDEARAAHYNAACAHTKLKQWLQAADSVKAAVNDYKLKLQVALEVRWQFAHICTL
jgi:tetratricopeptide (TPR) repeat protein